MANGKSPGDWPEWMRPRGLPVDSLPLPPIWAETAMPDYLKKLKKKQREPLLELCELDDEEETK